jgi:Na+-transporting methylmalonyl-CoA/oxaloacetate decarboxylase gamma subunit
MVMAMGEWIVLGLLIFLVIASAVMGGLIVEAKHIKDEDCES